MLIEGIEQARKEAAGLSEDTEEVSTLNKPRKLEVLDEDELEREKLTREEEAEDSEPTGEDWKELER